MKRLLSAFVAGLVFALGLVASGMTNPAKVVGFLDVTGPWDPSLAFVMAGAIAVHAGVARWAARASRPVLAAVFVRPPSAKIDAALLGGAALFGIGWGIAGMCPGPALVDLAAPSESGVTFVVAMLVGIVAFRRRSTILGKTQARGALRA